MIIGASGLVSPRVLPAGADVFLRQAAERAGLKMEFPWKTTMHVENEYVCVSNGYGSAYVYHYPLSGDRWLATTLHGDDISKVIALVEGVEYTCVPLA